jgi:hypothetical protein
MKISKIIFLSVSLLFSAASVQANNRYENYQGQGIWSFRSDKQAVQVFIKGSNVYAQVQSQTQLPATRLKRVNSNLLNDYTGQYIVIEDFNNDGWQDIGVLKSVGFTGNRECQGEHCYAVFEYVPGFYSFRSKASKTVCLN